MNISSARYFLSVWKCE